MKGFPCRATAGIALALMFSPWVPGEVGAPAPKAAGKQWSIAVLPDPQGYNQSYDFGGDWKGRGYQYKERFEQQVQWIVANRDAYNIRFAVDLGDNVQHYGYDPAKLQDPAGRDAKIHGEWLNAQRALNFFHSGSDPTQPAYLPYAVAIGNHDYHSNQPGDLTSTEYERFFGPGRWRDSSGGIRPAFADWYKGDDLGWQYREGGKVLAAGVGRNSFQIFSGGGRLFLHIVLECAPTNQAVAWTREVLARHARMPTIVSIHAFLRGADELATGARAGRLVEGGPNPTNDAPALWEKLIADHDQIFLVLCGHMYLQFHLVKKNRRGNDVHIMESCYHLDYDGGRIRIAQKPPGGWAYQGARDDLDRNGSGWMRLLLFDPDNRKIAAHTYSPVLGLWAANRAPTDRRKPDGQDGVWWNRTFPGGKGVTEEFAFDFDARFGAVAAPASGR